MNHSTAASLERTPLHALHLELGAKMFAFAGYELALNYAAGIIAEHQHTRAAAGLFDVSHMGQVRLEGDDRGAALESLVPGDIVGLAPGEMRYTLLTNERGGIRDDLMVTNAGEHLVLVVNAERKADDTAHMRAALAGRCRVVPLTERALLALQGPAAAAVLARHAPACAALGFMTAAAMPVAGTDCLVSRSGYTGEDGFEVSVAADEAPALARRLLAEPEVAPAGLGARDTLRLEAGLCLYGHDIDGGTTPVEAGLAWTVAERRRREGGFPGAEVILGQLRDGIARKRVGLVLEGEVPAREHAAVVDEAGEPIGEVTSGGFAPTLGRPVAMAYLKAAFARPDMAVGLVVRGKTLAARVVTMPFVRRRYFKG